MSTRKFSALLVGVILVITAVALLVPVKTSHDEPDADTRVLPELAEWINDVDRVAIIAGGNEAVATLVRSEGQWSVAELHGYPANWSTVRTLLAGLAEARVIEPKTDNPAYYDRLGVEGIEAAEASGLLMTLSGSGQETSVIVGHQAQGRDGRYLRVAGEARSVLSDLDAELPRQAIDWVDREFVDIAAEEVAEVEITHVDAERILLRKATEDETDFTLVNLPEGREVQSSWSLNAPAGVLASLRMESVEPQGDLDWNDATRIRLLTFSGLEISIDALADGAQYWVRLEAAAPHAPAIEAPINDNTAEVLPAEPVTGQVDELNHRLAGWAFGVPKYKYDAMTKRLQDLLKPEGEAQEDA